MNNEVFQPLNDWVAVERIAEKRITDEGVEIPDTVNLGFPQGHIRAISPTVNLPTLAPGDRVIYQDFGPTITDASGTTLDLVDPDNLIAQYTNTPEIRETVASLIEHHALIEAFLSDLVYDLEASRENKDHNLFEEALTRIREMHEKYRRENETIHQ